MADRIARFFVAACLVPVLSPAHAGGNAKIERLGSFGNWTVTASHALPRYRENIPDGVSAWGTTSEPGLSLELRCLTRNVDPEDVPNFAIDLHSRSIHQGERFYAIFSSGSAEYEVPMLGLDGQSASIRLSSKTFGEIFALLSAEADVEFTIWESADNKKSLHVRGSGHLRTFWENCGQFPS